MNAVRKSKLRAVRPGEKTRRAILEIAVDIASAEGLEGLTIGRLAAELKMSKSGLFAHFGSKEELQVAAVETAKDIFIREIVEPSSRENRGVARLHRMLLEWLGYVQRSVFRGGCFFAAASAEYDDRPGRVRDLIAQLTGAWLQAIHEEIRYAQKMAEMSNGIDAAQLSFELHALVQEANWAHRLLGDDSAFSKAKIGIEKRLHASLTARGRRNIKAGGKSK